MFCNNLFYIVPEGPPRNFNVTPINYTTVFLSWDRPEPTLENGNLTMYTIIYNGSRVEKQPVSHVFYISLNLHLKHINFGLH